MNMTQTHRDPADLKLHPLLKKQPGEWEDDDPRFIALVEDIRQRGIDQPIIVTKDMLVADGRHRLRGAKRLQIETIPCKICADDEVPAVILHSLLQRRHYTKGQLAYLLARTIDEAFVEAQKRQLAGLKHGDTAPVRNSVSKALTPEEWATQIGVSVQYLRQAKRIHEFFADDKKRKFNDEGKKAVTATLREFFEPKILDADEPHGLGAVIAGISSVLDAEKKGKPHKGGKPAETDRQLELFNKVVSDELNRWEYWQKFDDETKAEHFKSVRAQAAKIEDAEQLEQMAEYHSKLASEFRKAAKEAQAANGKK